MNADPGVGKSRWRGIIPVANTPFEGRALDIPSLERLADYLGRSGCSAVLLLGVASEADFMTDEERTLYVEVFSSTAPPSLDLIVSVSGRSAADVARAAKRGLAAGGSAVNWRPLPGTDRAELVHTMSLISETGLNKIMLQDFDLHGGGLPLSDILYTAERVPGLTSVKVETQDSFEKIERLSAICGDRLHFAAGWPIFRMIEAFDRGIPSFMPTSLSPLLQEIWLMHQSGEGATASRAYDRLGPLFSFMTRDLGRSIAVNKLLRLREGVFATAECRHPQAKLTLGEQKEAELLVADAVAFQSSFLRHGRTQ